MAHRHQVQARASGGRTHGPPPLSSGNKDVAAEAFSKGAKKKDGGKVEGRKAGGRLDKRARGGGVIKKAGGGSVKSESIGPAKNPFSSAKLATGGRTKK